MPHQNTILYSLVKTRIPSYVFSILSLTLASFFAFLVPYIGKISIDRIILDNPLSEDDFIQDIINQLGGVVFLSQNLWICGALIIGTTFFSGMFMYLKDYFSATACEEIVRGLRDQLYHHIHHLPNKFHIEVDTGDLLQRCTSDIDTLREFLTVNVMNIVRTVILVMLVIPLMIVQSWLMTGISLVLIPFVLTYAYLFFGKVKTLFLKVDEAEGELTTIVQENLTGIRVVRAFARQAYEIEKFEAKNRKYRDLDFQLVDMISKYWATSDLICFTQLGIVLFLGGWLVSQGILTLGTFFAFILYTSMLLWPIRELGKELSETGKAVIAIGRIQEILEEKVEPPTQNPIELPKKIKGDIVFQNVSFGFSPKELVLNHLSFQINAGETVAILGPTGSGKTTLIQLLLRLYDYEQGSIQLDGIELKAIDRKAIRSQIGTLLQEPFLFSRSLRSNIKLGNEKASDPEMIQSTKSAAIHHTITSFAEGYNTVIGERGVNLSGGQRQRVTLSRTFLKKPSILILDDTLSAVDTKTEQQILKAMQVHRGKQTTLMITHRISCCQHADKILIIENGTLTQEGNHHSLINRPGFYQKLCHIQLGQKDPFLFDQDRNVS